MSRPQLSGAFRIVCLSAALFAPAAAQADKFASIGSGWMQYSNDLFGTEFEYPANLFSTDPAPPRGDGRQFTSQDASLEIFATPIAEGETARNLKRRLLQEEEGYDSVTYAPGGDNWFVLSGFRGDTIFYEKYLLRDGIVHAFGIEFPASAKPFYAPLIERMEDSFRAGASVTPASVGNRRKPTIATDNGPSTGRDPLVVY